VGIVAQVLELRVQLSVGHRIGERAPVPSGEATERIGRNPDRPKPPVAPWLSAAT